MTATTDPIEEIEQRWLALGDDAQACVDQVRHAREEPGTPRDTLRAALDNSLAALAELDPRATAARQFHQREAAWNAARLHLDAESDADREHALRALTIIEGTF